MKRSLFLAGLLVFGSLAVTAQVRDVYLRWLNEDVLYLITPAERQAFVNLKTDEEREHFIEQFWLRRDPKPETEENEFREEYYQRIAHANMTFGFGKQAGWKTDRGRIHILYGAPDEVSDEGVTETWLYRNRPIFRGDAKFQFVDVNRNGEFRLRQ